MPKAKMLIISIVSGIGAVVESSSRGANASTLALLAFISLSMLFLYGYLNELLNKE